MGKSLTITRGDNTLIAPHFRASEFYSKSPDRPTSHSFPSELVEAAEFLRVHFGLAWRITSTYRTPTQEARICEVNNLPPGLATTSQHVLARAMDSQPAGTEAQNAHVMEVLALDFQSNGEVFQALRKIGVKGFGIYDTFIHLDVRTGPCIHKDGFGTFAAWDERHVEPKKKLIGVQAWNPTQHSTKKATPLRASSLSRS
jgi:hypothetical protein